jgi:hypothetical protein
VIHQFFKLADEQIVLNLVFRLKIVFLGLTVLVLRKNQLFLLLDLISELDDLIYYRADTKTVHSAHFFQKF